MLNIIKIPDRYLDSYNSENLHRNSKNFFAMSLSITFMEIIIITFQYFRLGSQLFTIDYFTLYASTFICMLLFSLLFYSYKIEKLKNHEFTVHIFFLLSLSVITVFTAYFEATYGNRFNVIFVAWVFYITSMLNSNLKVIISLIIFNTILVLSLIFFSSDIDIDKSSTSLNYFFLGTISIILSIPFYNDKAERFIHKMHLDEANEVLERNNKTLELLNKNLKVAASTDALTGALNRMAFNDLFQSSYELALVTKTPISVIMLDIDNFKKYNDHYGHIQGDECLKEVVNAISIALKRSNDQLFRYGGEEFAIILSDTNIDGATVTTDRIIKEVKNKAIPHITDLGIVTISAGIHSVIPSKLFKPYDLIDFADQALYKAKDNGKNRYEIYDKIVKAVVN